MFRWQKELDSLAIPARRVLRLQQSLNRVQVALPGLPSQEAHAYLCAFTAGQGVRVAAVLHLQASRRLAIYLNDQGEVADRRAGAVFSEGIGFVESMGFMLDDLQVQRRSPEEREALWKSLPLTGEGEENAPPASAARSEASAGGSGAFASVPSEEEEWMPPSLRRRLRPSPREMEERRLRLRENLGRFLASM